MAEQSKFPPFRAKLLHPRYWLLWFGLGVFRLILCLPYSWLTRIGLGLGALFSRLSFGKKRLAIAKRNLELCFPDKSTEEIDALVKANAQSVGMAIIETGMAWFWSDAHIKKHFTIHGIEHLQQAPRGVILVGVHFLTLELGARCVGLYHQGIGVYRPNDNALLDWIQYRGRVRSNKGMLNRKDLRGMIRALRKGETIWYAPDHDYGRKSSVFVPFFAVNEAATTTGSHLLINSAPEAQVIPFSPVRTEDGRYEIRVSAPVDFSQCETELDTARLMNRVVEREILNAPSQYMWLHRRFKTRPNEDAPSLYN